MQSAEYTEGMRHSGTHAAVAEKPGDVHGNDTPYLLSSSRNMSVLQWRRRLLDDACKSAS